MDSPPGWLGRLRAGLAKTRQALTARVEDLLGRGIDPSFYDELEEVLIQADLGVPGTEAVIARLRERARADARTPESLRRALVEILSAELGEAAALTLAPPPAVVVILGTNGAGKTTTIGKLEPG